MTAALVLASPSCLVLPPWLLFAFGELGVKERTGGETARIMEYHGLIDPSRKWLNEDEDPWCASFAGFCLEHGTPSVRGTRSAAAGSYETWGVPSEARAGALAVFYRSADRKPWDAVKNPQPRHVAFLLAESVRGVHVLGGNQGNGVSVTTIARSELIGYRWPAEGVK